MYKKKITVTFLCFVFFFLILTRVEAQEEKFSIGFNVGLCHWPSDVFKYLKFHQQESFSQIFQQASIFEQDIKLNTLYNLNFQYNLSPRFGIQSAIGHQEASYGIQFILTPKIGSTQFFPKHDLSWSLTTIFLNLIFRILKSENKVIPYGLIGLGLCFVNGGEGYYQDYYRINIPATTDLGLQVGAGLNFYLLSETVPIGIDLCSFIQALGLGFGHYGSTIAAGGGNIIWGIKIGLKYGFNP